MHYVTALDIHKEIFIYYKKYGRAVYARYITRFLQIKGLCIHWQYYNT